MANEVATISAFEFKNVVPAKVEAPGLDRLVANTDEMLKKYREFPVVEENYDQAKNTRKELRDTVGNIATTRKNTEKKILAQWSEIKTKIMGIEKSGKEADELMTKQMNVVEEARREKRQKVIAKEVAKIASDSNIDVSRIEFNPKWANVTYKHSEMLTEIDTQIEQIHKDDELRVLRINDIEVCANGFKVDPDPYISMLGMRDVVDIKSQIKRDVEIKEARIAEAKRVQEETEKVAKEREANANVVGDKLIDENGEVITPKPVEKVFERTLHVTGTIAELKSVAEFMATHHIKFRGGK